MTSKSDPNLQNSLPIRSADKSDLINKNVGLIKINKKKFLIDCPDNKATTDTCIQTETVETAIIENSPEEVPKDQNASAQASNTKPRQILICTSGTKYRVVSQVARELGWRNARESDSWNIHWTDCVVGVESCKQMKRFQKINHFPGMTEICRKDLLARNLTRMLKLFPNDYNIFPKTWCLPADLGEAEEYLRRHRNRTLILKPDHGSQGRGVLVTKTLKNYQLSDRMICQVYLTRPLLIDGFKFDLRVYALITSVDPLRIFVYNEGLARFATSPYREPNEHNVTNHYMHLTNYSVNKHSRTFVSDDEAGSKRSFESVQKLLLAEGYNVKKLWSDIDDVIIKTILSGWVNLKHNYKASFTHHDIMQACFEILGIDILVDQNLRPYILEVNHSPSFHIHEQVDKDVKTRLIRDTFTLLNIGGYDKKKIMDQDRLRVTKRLMKQIRSRSLKRISDSTIQSDSSESSEVWMNQINWEERNLGNYRRVMPNAGDPQRYAKYFESDMQYSVYADTAISKRREVDGRKTRLENEKRAQDRFIPNRIPKQIEDISTVKLKTQSKRRRSLVGKGFLSDSTKNEEVESNTTWAKRDIDVRKTGLLQFICHSHFQNNVMREEDQKRYRHLLALDLVQENDLTDEDGDELTFIEG